MQITQANNGSEVIVSKRRKDEPETQTSQSVDRTQIALLLVAVAPFLGYASAYLSRLAEAAYYRIPTNFIYIALKDALMAGYAILLILLVMLLVITMVTAAHRRRYTTARIRRTARHPYIAAASTLLLSSFALGLLAIIAISAFAPLHANDRPISAATNLKGADMVLPLLCFITFLAYLVAAVLYLRSSGIRRFAHRRPASVPLSLASFYFGSFAVLIVCAAIYVASYSMAAFLPQDHLVYERNHDEYVVLTIYSDGRAVSAKYDPTDRSCQSSEYEYISISDNQAAGEISNYTWRSTGPIRVEH